MRGDAVWIDSQRDFHGLGNCMRRITYQAVQNLLPPEGGWAQVGRRYCMIIRNMVWHAAAMRGTTPYVHTELSPHDHVC